MARRGTFGRMPRQAQNLTNTVVAIAREMQSQRDQNIMSAWQKGGMFEGKKATDEMVLAHWRQRASMVDKNDPLYDTYKNAATEYEYAIAESKTSLAFAQGKISAQKAAAFYTNWSHKVPKNSEFWRILQRDAANLLRSVRAQSEADKKRKAEEKYQNDQRDLYNTHMKAGQYITDVLTQIARHGDQSRLSDTGDSLVDPQNGSILGFAPDDVSKFIRMIQGATERPFELTPEGKKRVNPASGHASNDVLYHDDDGKPVTGQSVVDALKAIDPKFNGTLTPNTINDYLARVQEGLTKAAALAERTGHLTDAKNFKDQKAQIAELRRQQKALPVEAAYLESHNAMMAVLNDRKSSDQDKKDAIEEHRRNTANYANDPRIADNDNLKNKFIAESKGNAEATSGAEDWTGLIGPSANKGDIASINNVLAQADYNIKGVESGAMQWTTGAYDKDGVFQPGAGGSQIGAATPEQIANNSGGIPPQSLVLKDAGGRVITVAVMGQPITVKAVDGATGNALHVAPGTNPTFGYVFVAPDGTRTVQYKDGKGNMLVSNWDDAPWGAGAKVTEDGKGFTITLTGPTNEAELKGATGFAKSADGKAIVYDPYTSVLSTDKEHQSAIKTGGDPRTDFRSINAAYYANNPAKAAEYNLVKGTEAYRALVDQQTHAAVGSTMQYDAKGNPLGYAGGDTASLGLAVQQNVALATGADPGAGYKSDAKASELLPGPHETGPDSGANVTVDDILKHSIGSVQPLATDQVSGTSFGLLGEYFQQGNLNPRPQGGTETPFGVIKVGPTLKVPAPPKQATMNGGANPYAPPTFTPPPAPAYTGGVNNATGFTIPGVTGGGTSGGYNIPGSTGGGAGGSQTKKAL